ncbi:MAG: FliM/FliN family flagellar motor C-terminal domain-containing protein, partial [Bryobacteraceae bacterium]
AEQERVLRFLRDASLAMEARLTGPTLTVQDLLRLEEGQLLTFDHPVGRPVDLEVNGGRKFSGHVVTTGRKRAFQVEEMHPAPYSSDTSGVESGPPSGGSG